MTTPRLTPEQAKFAEAHVRGTLPAYDGSVEGIRAHADALRIQHEYGKSAGVSSFVCFSMVEALALDLLDEVKALRDRAEQAERDRAVLAEVVHLQQTAMNEDTQAAWDLAESAFEAVRAPTGALDRAKSPPQEKGAQP